MKGAFESVLLLLAGLLVAYMGQQMIVKAKRQLFG